MRHGTSRADVTLTDSLIVHGWLDSREGANEMAPWTGHMMQSRGGGMVDSATCSSTVGGCCHLHYCTWCHSI